MKSLFQNVASGRTKTPRLYDYTLEPKALLTEGTEREQNSALDLIPQDCICLALVIFGEGSFEDDTVD